MNGEEMEGTLFGGCLMAFDLEPGQYSFEMKYVPKGFGAGAAVSGVSAAVLGTVLFVGRKGRRRKGGPKQEDPPQEGCQSGVDARKMPEDSEEDPPQKGCQSEEQAMPEEQADSE